MLEIKMPGQVASYDAFTLMGKIRGEDGKLYKFHSSFAMPRDASIYEGKKVFFVPMMDARGYWAHSIEVLR